jgi:hypothetical protein
VQVPLFVWHKLVIRSTSSGGIYRSLGIVFMNLRLNEI